MESANQLSKYAVKGDREAKQHQQSITKIVRALLQKKSFLTSLLSPQRTALIKVWAGTVPAALESKAHYGRRNEKRRTTRRKTRPRITLYATSRAERLAETTNHRQVWARWQDLDPTSFISSSTCPKTMYFVLLLVPSFNHRPPLHRHVFTPNCPALEPVAAVDEG